jgi:hypothetical protein
MKNKINYVLTGLFTMAFLSGYAQYGDHQGQGHHGGHHRGDTTGRSGHVPPKMEKGPHKGKMMTKDGLKMEMVPPSNEKGNDVSYFLYDSLNKTVEAKSYTGTVKYVFGGPNEYLETKLSPSGASNQYVATLEGWQEYKKAIVTLKVGDKTYTFFFPGAVPPSQSSAGGGGHHGGHGGHGGHHGGGQGGGMDGGMGGMGGGGQGSSSGY